MQCKFKNQSLLDRIFFKAVKYKGFSKNSVFTATIAIWIRVHIAVCWNAAKIDAKYN